MKKFTSFMLMLFLVLAILPISSRDANAQLISKQEIINAYTRLSDYTIAVAETMPAEFYGHKPNEEIMTFAEQMNHVAGSNYFIGTILKKEMRKELKATDKAQVMADLKESCEYAKKALEEATMDDLMEEMEFFTGPRTRFHAYLFMVDHMTHHRGYSIVYLRTKGIAPPAFTSW